MVSFICNACGQTVRKNQVEKHYNSVCRQCEVLSCIDCGKDFHGDDYANHTSCISEAEKYQGKLFQPKDRANKGEQKQQQWIKQLQEVSSSDIDPSIKRHLKTLKQYSNIPRKKAKFQNFCKNSVKIFDQTTLDKLWEAFSGAKESTNTNGTTQEKTAEHTTENNNNNNNEDDKQPEKEIPEDSNDKPVDKKSKNKKEKRKRKKDQEVEIEENSQAGSKSKKRKRDVEAEEEKQTKKKSKKKRKQEQDENHNNDDVSLKAATSEENGHAEEHVDEPNNKGHGKFNWGSVIKQVLKKSPDNELPVKKLRKKVIAEFLSRGGDGKTYNDNELRALFATKLNKNPKFKVKKEVAKLCK